MSAQLTMANPMSAVDEVRVARDGELIAFKRITLADPYLPGGRFGTSYPGAFVVESVLQAARRLLGMPALSLVEVDFVRLQAPLLPGDTMRMSLAFHRLAAGRGDRHESGEYEVRARCSRANGSAAAAVTLCCASLHTRRAHTDPDHTDEHGVAAPTVRRLRPEQVNVRDLLPQRPPALLVDRIVEHVSFSGRWRLVTEYTVRANQPCYRAASSIMDRQVYPDTLVIESFVQSASALLMLHRGRPGGPLGWGVHSFDSASAVRLFEPVLPGQTLRHDVWFERFAGGTVLVSGSTHADGRPSLTVGSLALPALDQAVGFAA
jgi:3-hydroxymyristoyl/3-hydroxydecanoyl-(acyl carrier protein) dehydratase